MGFNHFDENGNAVMVDVSGKGDHRAYCGCKWEDPCEPGSDGGDCQSYSQKGDVLTVARVAGIMGTKQTSNLIPMCHPLCLNKCTVDFEVRMRRMEAFRHGAR